MCAVLEQLFDLVVLVNRKLILLIECVLLIIYISQRYILFVQCNNLLS